METYYEGRTTQNQSCSSGKRRRQHRRGFAIAMAKKPPQSSAVNELIVTQVSAGITLHEFEHATREMYVTEALRQNGGNMSKTAKQLGLHRNTMGRIIEELAG